MTTRELLRRLTEAGAIETVQRVALATGVSTGKLLTKWPGNHPCSRAIGAMYEALEADGHTHERIGYLTGRTQSAVSSSLRARREAWEAPVRALAKELLGPRGPSLAQRVLAKRAMGQTVESP